MIVSNSNALPSVALQGIDLLARSGRLDLSESTPSDFSGLLGASLQEASKGALEAADRRQPQGSVPAAGKGESSGLSDGACPSSSAPAQAVATASDASAQAAVSSGLVDEPPLLRDPRLNDPLEVALEAAAIAAAMSLLPKVQGPVAGLVSPEEPQLDVGSERGGGQARADEQPAGTDLPWLGLRSVAHLSVQSQFGAVPSDAVSPVPFQSGFASSASSAAELSPSAGLAFATGVPLADDNGSLTTPAPGSPAPESLGSGKGKGYQGYPSSLSHRVSASAPSAPDSATLSSVVVKATLAEADGLAEAGATLIPSLQAAPLVPREVVPAVTATPRFVDSGDGLSPHVPSGVSAKTAPSEARLAADLGVSGGSDAEFLSSPSPENPAAVFFAADVQGKESRASSLGDQEPSAVKSEQVIPQGSAESRPGVVDAEVKANAETPDHGAQGGAGFDRSGTGDAEEQSTNRSSKSSLVESTPSDLEAALAPEPELSQNSKGEVGTLGAKVRFVPRETSPESFELEEATTPSRATEGGLGSISSTASEVLGVTTSQSATADRAVRDVSRPVVLPPVHVKSSELASVVQNALERARSENPSHLSVEVRLEDGSSFGLEVRMSATGLQASFRSESQSLLKALENGWTGFVSKESSDTRVVAAAFEGRSGSGDLSGNGSNAGERRQQLEDNASSASLNGSQGGSLRKGASAKETTAELPAANDGIALYA